MQIELKNDISKRAKTVNSKTNSYAYVLKKIKTLY